MIRFTFHSQLLFRLQLNYLSTNLAKSAAHIIIITILMLQCKIINGTIYIYIIFFVTGAICYAVLLSISRNDLRRTKEIVSNFNVYSLQDYIFGIQCAHLHISIISIIIVWQNIIVNVVVHQVKDYIVWLHSLHVCTSACKVN